MGQRYEVDGAPPPQSPHARKILNRKLVDLNAEWVLWAAFNSAGCRALQAVVAESRAPHHAAILRMLLRKCTVQDMYRSPHANFVLQSIIHNGPGDMLEPILSQLQGGVAAMCRHKYGSRVGERIIENASPSRGRAFFDELVEHAPYIARSKYGNYVVQSFLEHNPRNRDCALALLPSAKELVTRKWSSFVIRFAIPYCDEDVREMFAAELGCDSRYIQVGASSTDSL